MLWHTTLAAAFLAALASSASACPLPPGASATLGARSAQSRLQFIDQQTQRSASLGRWWRGAWTATFALQTAAQVLAASAVDDPKARTDLIIGGLEAGLGLTAFVLRPLTVIEHAPQIARLAAGPSTCIALAEAEALFALAAENQRRGQAWFVHFGNILYNLAFGLILGVGYHHWTPAIINLAVGPAVGELVIFTQPNALVRARRDYLAGHLSPSSARLALQWRPIFGEDRWLWSWQASF